MLMVMEMSTGKIIKEALDDELGDFKDEVLNAEWTPASPELRLGLQEVHASHDEPPADADAFLAAVYRSQQ